MLSAEFFLTSLIIILIPGTGVIYTISTGIFLGKRASIAAALGCTAGILPHLAASILGLSAIMHMSSLAFQIIKYAGVLYLLYLACCMWRETGSLQITAKSTTNKTHQVALKAFLVNILNPKLSIFFLAFLPPFISSSTSSPLLQLVFMGILFMLMTFIIFVLYGLSAHSVRRYIIDSPRNSRYLQRSFAALFAAFGIKLALTQQ